MNDQIQKLLAKLEEDYYKGKPIPFDSGPKAILHLALHFDTSYEEIVNALHRATHNSIASLLALPTYPPPRVNPR